MTDIAQPCLPLLVRLAAAPGEAALPLSLGGFKN